jgi:hypothetical protein
MTKTPNGNASFRLIALFVQFLIYAIISLPGASSHAGASGQPIAFNHQKHIQNNVQCEVCHQYYAKSNIAGLPSVRVCIRCHEDVIFLTPEKEKLQRYSRSGEEIPWKLVSSVPPHVYFSHKRHVTFGKIECSACHGDAAQWTSPPTEPAVPLDMNMCINCHQQMREKTNLVDVYNCNRCHR